MNNPRITIIAPRQQWESVHALIEGRLVHYGQQNNLQMQEPRPNERATVEVIQVRISGVDRETALLICHQLLTNYEVWLCDESTEPGAANPMRVEAPSYEASDNPTEQ